MATVMESAPGARLDLSGPGYPGRRVQGAEGRRHPYKRHRPQ